MSIGSAGGVAGSAAGAPLAHTKGTELERAGQDSASQQRQLDSNQNAENAAGIGQTGEDRQASDRDADGRRIWENPQRHEQVEADGSEPLRQGKDARGERGGALDLTG
ncbi:MAG: hypothetical protein A2W31_11860 [Planctomycetes bacterium RBG_16_64_10]|nr:MAG: hypothetical protein A2W31_11860 [Planctomycetes bacterium RBG_16_64_10]